MRRLPSILTAAALSVGGLAAVVSTTAPPASAATPGARVTMIGDRNLVGLQNSSKATRDQIAATYPLSIDGAACRGTVRNNCGAPGNPQIPAAGLPASAYDVIKANTGQLGDIVVLGHGLQRPDRQPEHAVPARPRPLAVQQGLRPRHEPAAGRAPGAEGASCSTCGRATARIPALQVNKYKAINDRLTAISTPAPTRRCCWATTTPPAPAGSAAAPTRAASRTTRSSPARTRAPRSSPPG